MTPTLTPVPPTSSDEIRFCSHCGTPVESGSIFCRKCSCALSPPASLTDVHEAPTTSVPQVRPWIRYWARFFDFSVWSIFCGLLIGMYFPTFPLEKANDLALNMMLLLAWIFIESLLLAFVGTTPGKMLFRIQLTLPGKKSIPFADAFVRSGRVWWRGMGTGFPLVSFFTLWHAESVLSNEGITSWDRDGNFQVRHEKIGALRVVVAVVLLTLFYALMLSDIIAESGHNR